MLKQFAYRVSPQLYTWLYREKQIRGISNNAAELRARVENTERIADLVDNPELLRAGPFWSNQKRAEIIHLLDLLKERQPQYLCEIGAFKGGTLFLFSQIAASNARILSIDIDYPEKKKRPFRRFARPGQHIHCFEADSHSTKALATVKKILSGQQLDFLFIDGDHSYQGVKTDFELYSPLVRPKGLIAFHDIVPDYGYRFGTETSNNTGEVPVFWKEIKDQFKHWEFIEDIEQDGYGIGVIEWQT